MNVKYLSGDHERIVLKSCAWRPRHGGKSQESRLNTLEERIQFFVGAHAELPLSPVTLAEHTQECEL